MLVRAYGATLVGVEGVRVSVEVDAGRGLPSFSIVGRGDRVVAESRDRIRAAFRQLDLEFPPGRVTVNLAPTELPKAGSSLDLAIAVAVAATRSELSPDALERTLLVGELGLDGRLHPVRGALALAAAAGVEQRPRVIVPRQNLAEASLCPGAETRGADNLKEVLAFLAGSADLPREPDTSEAPAPPPDPDLAVVRGQETGRRALEVAAAGGHNLLLVGPPGSGKTLLARCLPGVLPELPFAWALEATRIHSVAGVLGRGALLRRPPFRAPHHTTSDAGLIGGGRPLRPGEVSLAHRGVLFLDELPEFRRHALEALRQPLEEGRARVGRAHGSLELAARFQLVAAMNPCPCGHQGDPVRECACDDAALRRYRGRVSGPLLDRIDLHAAMPRVPWRALAAANAPEPSARVAERVARARAVQKARSGRGEKLILNAALPPGHPALEASPDARRLLERAVARMGLSVRGVQRCLRLARTIADLEPTGPERPLGSGPVAEALGFRAPAPGR